MKRENNRSKRYGRRQFLKSLAVPGAITMTGCLGVLDPKEAVDKTSTPSPKSPATTHTETGFKTRTFRETPTTPYPGPVTYSGGGGPIDVRVYSDYSHDESAHFWNNTMYKLRNYYISDVDGSEEPEITIILRHFPKPVNKWSMFLPCATMEVGIQEGILPLAEFHERLFENHYPDYSTRDVEIAASMVGADPGEVVIAGKERRRSGLIKQNIEEGKKAGFNEPLGITVNDTPVENTSVEAIEQAIEREL